MLSSHHYFHATPLIKFNRVTGLLPAARLEVGKRRKMGPLWMLYIPNSVRERLTKLSGDIGYGFGYSDLSYRLGGNMIWGEPDISNVGISAQIYLLPMSSRRISGYTPMALRPLGLTFGELLNCITTI